MAAEDPSIDTKILRIAQEIGEDSGEFSFWEFVRARDQGPEVALAYARIFWPELVQVGTLVLLAERYDEEYLARTINTHGIHRAEETINTTYLHDLFGGLDANSEVWEYLGKLLCVTWRLRAETRFPGQSFTTAFAWYSDDGDPGVTLFRSPTSPQ